MKFKIIITQIAKTHAKEAISFYKLNSISASKEFSINLKKSINHLELNPYHYKITEKHRMLPLNKFPYLLIYEVDEVLKTVKVVAIFNTNQSTVKYPK